MSGDPRGRSTSETEGKRAGCSYSFSNWLNSSGGPLVMMEERKAHLWTGVNGTTADYEVACQSDDYASQILSHGANVLILGDEPLQTMVAIGSGVQLLVRWKWADSDADVRSAIEQLDLSAASPIETLAINWPSESLVIFDSADTFNPAANLKFSASVGMNAVSTFIHEPTPRLSLLIHAVRAM
ncbi:Imm21 family immunity protein [Robbsia sp. KACC 23696]|uniref:Imm21 family immunity protein n=1 Tax=Robbsia sp. KACC 23696 TaxID=3149231 RepID=UPI00325C139E